MSLAGAALVLVVAVMLERSATTRYTAIRDALWTLPLGISMAEVSQLVDIEPIRRETFQSPQTDADVVVWYYDHDPVAAVIPQLTFDKDTGQLIAVVVDDERRRRSPETSKKAGSTPMP